MPSANSAKPFKSLKAAMRRRPRLWSLLSVIFPGHDCISRSRRAPAAGSQTRTFLFGLAEGSGLAARLVAKDFLSPSLQSRPDLCKGSEFCATANEDADLALHRIDVVGGLAHIFDMFEFAFQDFPGIVKN